MGQVRLGSEVWRGRECLPRAQFQGEREAHALGGSGCLPSGPGWVPCESFPHIQVKPDETPLRALDFPRRRGRSQDWVPSLCKEGVSGSASSPRFLLALAFTPARKASLQASQA